MAHFAIPLDLPHAGTIAWRIETLIGTAEGPSGPERDALLEVVAELRDLLEPYRAEGENPADEAVAVKVVGRAAELGRAIVSGIERQGLGGDRIGQCVRNLFECLEMGEEGARISLRAGENPRSALRPV
jgi:hypothetical protein